MKLLIVTQKVDRSDPILGFFHRWVGEFARQCDAVTVIGQLTGEYAFGDTVRVETLGKEKGRSRFRQILRFWQLIRRHRHEYDAVLVHMTPVWIVLGAPFWRLARKPMYLWYEARGKRWPLRVALRCVRKVFSASVHGMPLATDRSVVVGHGIDTAFFRPGEGSREPGQLLTVGRITASKNLPVIFAAFERLPKVYRLTVVGRAVTEEDQALLARLEERIRGKNLGDRVAIRQATQEELLPLLQQAEVFVHASNTSLDKAVLEAMAAGCVVVSTAEAVQPLLHTACRASERTFAAHIDGICSLPDDEREAIAAEQRWTVEQSHSLQRLIGRLLEEMGSVP